MQSILPNSWPRTFSVIGIGAVSLIFTMVIGLTATDQYDDVLAAVVDILFSSALNPAALVAGIFASYLMGELSFMLGRHIAGWHETNESRSVRDAKVSSILDERLSKNYDANLHAIDLWRALAIQILSFGMIMSTHSLIQGDFLLSLGRFIGTASVTWGADWMGRSYMRQIESDIVAFEQSKADQPAEQ